MGKKKGKVVTHIPEEHRHVFNALTSGQYHNFALFSCTVNGEPAAAIIVVGQGGKGKGEEVRITPLFVSVTPGMVLKDHDGVEAGE